MNWNILINPFERIAGYQALAVGLSLMVVSAILSVLLHTRFDGVLDLHFVLTQPGWKTALIDQVINLFSLFTVFFGLALLFGAVRTRWVDIAGTFALARAPYTLMPLLNINNRLGEFGQAILDQISGTDVENLSASDLIDWWIVPIMFILFLALVWKITLYFFAYKVSTNLKGSKLAISFILGIFLAEVLSKVLIYLIHS